MITKFTVMTKKKRVKGRKPVEVPTKRGRVRLPEWVHVRDDLWNEIICLLVCVKEHLRDSGSESDLRWLAEESDKLLKEMPESFK